jgi:hypothetical protein
MADIVRYREIVPQGVVLPPTPTVEDFFYLTVDPIGLYVCTATGVWTLYDNTIPIALLVTDTHTGIVPATGGGTANFLRADTTWAVPPGTGSAAWGGITGTLSAQTDLQTVLDSKGTSNFSGVYADLTGKPTLGTAAATAITDYATAAQGTTANSALQPAGNGSALTGLTKGQVGLGNVDNTTDAGKPISSATQTALDAKQATLVSATNIKTINGSTVLGSGDLVVGGGVAWGGVTGTLSNQTDLQTALNGKQASGSYATGTGTANGTNTGDQTTVSGNAGTATTLQTPRNINGVAFNGSADITVTANVTTLTGFPGGTSTYLRADGAFATPAGGGGGMTLTPLVKDLGVAQRAGTFDITGLSGLTTDKPVLLVSTSAIIPSKGDARDENELDPITLSGYVLDANTIRAYWSAQTVIVGDRAFGYQVSA